MRTLFRALYSVGFFIWFFISCGIFFVGALVLYLFVTLPFDRVGRLQHLYTCFWGQAYFYLNPLWRSRAEHAERIAWMKPAVLVANHDSATDIIALCALYRPFKFISKASNVWVPFAGWNMLLNGYPLVVRGNRESVVRMMAGCRRWLDRGMPVLFFAEGTRSRDGRVQRFKDGAFQLALDVGCPIVPIVTTGTAAMLPKNGFFLSPRADCCVRVLEPVDVGPFRGDVAALRNHVRALIVAEKERALGLSEGALDGLREAA